MKKSAIADTVLLFVTLIWGIMFVFVKEAVEVMPPFTHLAFRFGVAAVVMWIWYRFSRGREPMNASLLRDGAIMGFWLFTGFAFQTYGLQLTSASKAGFITGLNVVLVPVIAAWFMKAKLKKTTAAGVAIATAGLFLLTLGKSIRLELGDLLVLVCAFGFAMHIVRTGMFTSRHDPVSLSFVQITVVAILNIIAALFTEDWRPALSMDVLGSLHVVRAVLIGAVFATAFAFWAQTYFQRFTTPTHTAIIFSSEPVFAAAAGVVLSGEILTGQAYLGSALILAGILLAEMKSSGEA